MLAYLWVAIGGALGSMARFGMNGVIPQKTGSFPWATLIINISGSLVIGILGALTASHGRMTTQSRLLATQLLITGVCGGYTTFSSFSLQTLYLIRDGEWFYAAGNILLSVLFCLIAVWIGYVIGDKFN